MGFRFLNSQNQKLLPSPVEPMKSKRFLSISKLMGADSLLPSSTALLHLSLGEVCRLNNLPPTSCEDSGIAPTPRWFWAVIAVQLAHFHVAPNIYIHDITRAGINPVFQISTSWLLPTAATISVDLLCSTNQT